MIRTNKFYKVYAQDDNGEGCGPIVASFPESRGGRIAAENDAADRARRSPGTRFYVLAASSGVYVDETGGITRREY